MIGVEAALEVLAEAGITRLFGNPGTTELPLNVAAMRDPRFQYVFGIHEIPVVAMADGFSLASRQPSFVNLHVACGLGNAMGMLFNASVEGTPLVVTTGDQDRRLEVGDPVLAGDMVAMAKPLTKWARRVERVEDLPDLLRQAIQAAMTPPTGPVFLALPLDIQMELADHLSDLRGPCLPDTRVRPPREAIDVAARVLAGARRPLILAGSRVTDGGATDELALLAEAWGAAVHSESTPSHGRLPLAPAHPLCSGPLSPWAPEVQKQLADHDVILAVGMNVFRWYIHQPVDQVLPPGSRLVHLDCLPEEIGKSHPVDAAVVGDVREGLRDLLVRLRETMTPEEHAAAAVRLENQGHHQRQQRAALRDELEQSSRQSPMGAKALMHSLIRVLPDDVAVVEEAITTHHHLLERTGALADPRGYFAHRAWALGWGLGCALGVKLAWPDRPTLALLGDGASLYGIQGLWSAAHHQIPVTFVIANNGQYRILKQCGDLLDLRELHDPRCPGVNLVQPAVDFVKLSESLGVEAVRVETPDAVSDEVASSLRSDRPRLIEVTIAGD